jgi:hypothetical protein
MLRKVGTFICLSILIIFASFLFQSPSFAFDPLEREAKAQERENNAKEHVDRALETGIDTAREVLRRTGNPNEAITEAGKAVVRQCTSCHDPGPSSPPTPRRTGGGKTGGGAE